MPDYDTKHAAIETHFATTFALLPAAQVRYEDTPWRRPNGVDEWVELFVVFGASQNISVGTMQAGGTLRRRFVGTVIVHVYTPDTPTQALRRRKYAIAEAVGNVFENQTISGITFREVRVVPTSSPAAGYQRLMVQVPFQWDETT